MGWGEGSHFDKRRNREINKIKWGRRMSVMTANYGFDNNIFFGLVCLRACNHPLSQGILFKKGGGGENSTFDFREMAG